MGDLKSKLRGQNRGSFPDSDGRLPSTDSLTVHDMDNEHKMNGLQNGSGDTNTEGRSISDVGPPATDDLDALGKDVRRLMKGIQNLRHLGIEDANIPLPKITVVGDQSTGKSSVIEGISGIKVPKSAGTCTRCPLEVNSYESSDPLCIKFFLHKKYQYEKGLRNAATSKRPLGPWTPKEPEDVEFAILNGKDGIEETLRRAQLAILNPSTPYGRYQVRQGGLSEEKTEVQFSPNVIRLEITGPGLPNIVFYDLPGVISQSSRDGEEYLIRLVRNLVKEYIRAENCIILLTLTMNHDAANSNAAGIIKEIPGAQDRTIGVLTKPDLLRPEESVSQWTDILDGREYVRKLGYFVVKNNTEPDVEQQVARAEEEQFFRAIDPRLARYAHRFGTQKLQQKLSLLLGTQIKESLPLIHNQVNQKIRGLELELETLPRPPDGNLAYEVQSKIQDFSRELQHEIAGGSSDYPFFKTWHQRARKFRAELVEGRPKLLLPPPPRSLWEEDTRMSEGPTTPTPMRKPIETICIDSLEEDTPYTPPSKTRKRQTHVIKTSTPFKRPKLCDIPEHDYACVKTRSKPASFNLPQIRDIIDDANTGLPGMRSPRVTQRIYKDSTEHWDELLDIFLKESHVLCEQAIVERTQTTFGKWRGTPLLEKIEEIVGCFLQQSTIEQSTTARRLLTMEKESIMTLNKEAKNLAEQSALTELKNARLRNRIAHKIAEMEAQSGKPLTDSVRKEKQMKLTEESLGPDEWHQEITELATVRGYYHHASSRFADMVALSVRTELFTKCLEGLWLALVKGLDIDKPDANARITRLLEISPEHAARRVSLEYEHGRLLEGLKQLGELVSEVPPEESG